MLLPSVETFKKTCFETKYRGGRSWGVAPGGIRKGEWRLRGAEVLWESQDRGDPSIPLAAEEPPLDIYIVTDPGSSEKSFEKLFELRATK